MIDQEYWQPGPYFNMTPSIPYDEWRNKETFLYEVQTGEELSTFLKEHAETSAKRALGSSTTLQICDANTPAYSTKAVFEDIVFAHSLEEAEQIAAADESHGRADGGRGSGVGRVKQELDDDDDEEEDDEDDEDEGENDDAAEKKAFIQFRIYDH